MGGVEILLVPSCYGNRDKLRPDGPLGSYADLTYLTFEKKPTKNGNRYVLVVVDFLTRAAEMIPIPDKSAKSVANGGALRQDGFCRRGIPESIFTARGCEFDNQTLSTIAQELGNSYAHMTTKFYRLDGFPKFVNMVLRWRASRAGAPLLSIAQNKPRIISQGKVPYCITSLTTYRVV